MIDRLISVLLANQDVSILFALGFVWSGLRTLQIRCITTGRRIASATLTALMAGALFGAVWDVVQGSDSPLSIVWFCCGAAFGTVAAMTIDERIKK